MKIYKHIHTGQKITEYTYDSLDLYDKIDYEYYGDTYTNSDSNLTDDLIGLGVGLLLGGLFDSGDSASSNGDSFDGFGGGDFGGGGASGEW